MILCIITFVADEADETELWLNTIDRGGLWHVNDIIYAFLQL